MTKKFVFIDIHKASECIVYWKLNIYSSIISFTDYK